MCLLTFLKIYFTTHQQNVASLAGDNEKTNGAFLQRVQAMIIRSHCWNHNVALKTVLVE